MKIIYLFFKISGFSILISFLESCDHKPEYSYFLIKVDSIHVPGNITASAPFDIDFFGTIAGGGCHSFSNFNVNQENNNLLIEAWSKVDRKSVVCPSVMVYLTGQKVTYTIEAPGIYNIRIKQPYNTYLDKQISVN